MKIALIYDFDKTLSTTDMQNYDFIKNLKMNPKDFWDNTGKIVNDNESDKILAYMYMMVKECKNNNIKLTREYLNSCGNSIEFYNGVDTWFQRINQYAFSLGVTLEHYIVSSGITEIIEGTPISKYFKKIYGCSFLYKDGEAVWPKTAINYTNKTQFIFRIAKGALDIRDDDSVNKKTNKLVINYDNMIYFGDGLTDIPCMKIVKESGGKSIAIYQTGKENKILPLLTDDRVNFALPSDYSENSKLENVVKMIIGNMVTINNIRVKEKMEFESILGKKNED
ncbi:MAG: haloacid dehalogenase-like hydrolase [Acholeplasmatales bacterium]|nr:haloacid dehalogenase-like hydrolase [Acholeplasmatales bacterium]